MNRHEQTGRRLIALFIIGMLLLTYPILSLFDTPEMIGGIPILFIYLFAVWTAVIGLTALIVWPRRRREEKA